MGLQVEAMIGLVTSRTLVLFSPRTSLHPPSRLFGFLDKRNDTSLTYGPCNIGSRYI